jgi:hypothetical protein
LLIYRNLRDENRFTEIINQFKEFKINSTLNYNDFKPLKINCKKIVPRMSGKYAIDKSIDESLNNFRVNTYFSAIDITLTQIKDRFSYISTGIYIDLSLFSCRRIKEIANDESKLPSNSFLCFVPCMKSL